MKLAGVDRRGKVMLCAAWISSSICSMPQAIIFHVENHPNITNYKQCVTYNFFRNQFHEVIYSFLGIFIILKFDPNKMLYFNLHLYVFTIGMVLMYALPLIIIIYCYASIYFELYRKSRKCVTGNFFKIKYLECVKNYLQCV